MSCNAPVIFSHGLQPGGRAGDSWTNVPCSYFCIVTAVQGKCHRFDLPDSRRGSCQFLEKECALNTGKLPPGGLPRNSVVKKLTFWT